MSPNKLRTMKGRLLTSKAFARQVPGLAVKPPARMPHPRQSAWLWYLALALDSSFLLTHTLGGNSGSGSHNRSLPPTGGPGLSSWPLGLVLAGSLWASGDWNSRWEFSLSLALSLWVPEKITLKKKKKSFTTFCQLYETNKQKKLYAV